MADDSELPTKVCTTCKKEKLLALFHKDTGNPDGYRYDCSECRNRSVKYSPSRHKLYKKYATKAKAKEKSRRFFLEESMWQWKGARNKRYRERENRRNRKTNETDDIIVDFGL